MKYSVFLAIYFLLSFNSAFCVNPFYFETGGYSAFSTLASIANIADIANYANTANSANTAGTADYASSANTANTAGTADYASAANTANSAGIANIASIVGQVALQAHSYYTITPELFTEDSFIIDKPGIYSLVASIQFTLCHKPAIIIKSSNVSLDLNHLQL